MRARKPNCYLEKRWTGYFMMEYTYCWYAFDDYNNVVATGKTRKDCENVARAAGYTPRKS